MFASGTARSRRIAVGCCATSGTVSSSVCEPVESPAVVVVVYCGILGCAKEVRISIKIPKPNRLFSSFFAKHKEL